MTKAVGGYLGARSLGHWGAATVGFGMVPRGEVGIVVANLGLAAGLLSQGLFSAVLIAVVLTTVVAPVPAGLVHPEGDRGGSGPRTCSYLTTGVVPPAGGGPSSPSPVATERAPGRRSGESATAEQPSSVGGFGRGGAPPSGAPQDRIDLVAIRTADRHPVEPLDVLDVRAGDLTQRPAGIAAEVEDAPGRRCPVAGPAAPVPSDVRIDGS